MATVASPGLLTLLLLYQLGHQVGRFISLERITEESRETYNQNPPWCGLRWKGA